MNHLYQVSSIKNFKQGEFDGCIAVEELKSYGDTGMGTFNGLDGEMIMVDGIIYKANGECQLEKAHNLAFTPFSTLGFLTGTKMIEVEKKKDISLIEAKLDASIKIDDPVVLGSLKGTFLNLEIHSVYQQKRPYHPLEQIVKAQKVVTFNQVKGTMVAVRCPQWAKGLNVVGWHFHFISNDHKWGGHVNNFGIKLGRMDYSIKNKIIQIDEKIKR